MHSQQLAKVYRKMQPNNKIQFRRVKWMFGNIEKRGSGSTWKARVSDNCRKTLTIFAKYIETSRQMEVKKWLIRTNIRNQTFAIAERKEYYIFRIYNKPVGKKYLFPAAQLKNIVIVIVSHQFNCTKCFISECNNEWDRHVSFNNC